MYAQQTNKQTDRQTAAAAAAIKQNTLRNKKNSRHTYAMFKQQRKIHTKLSFYGGFTFFACVNEFVFL